MTISAAQCRAARALLDWSQDKLAREAKVARQTLSEFENERTKPFSRTLDDLRTALAAAGIEFIPEGEGGGGAGVRFSTARQIRPDFV